MRLISISDSNGDNNDASGNNCDGARLQPGPQLRQQRPEIYPKDPDTSKLLSTDNGSFNEESDIDRQLLNDEENPTADLKRSGHLMKTLRFKGLGKRIGQQNKNIGNADQNRLQANLRRQRRDLSPVYLLDEKALEREIRDQQKPRISAGMRYTGIGKRSGEVYRNTLNSGHRHRYYGLGKR